MIGKLLIDARGKRILAVLDDDLTWSCDDADYLKLLNELFPAPLPDHTGMIRPEDQLLHHLYSAGERLGARVDVVRGINAPAPITAA